MVLQELMKDDFPARLLESKTVEIWYERVCKTQVEGQEPVTSRKDVNAIFPAVLLCAISVRFRQLCLRYKDDVKIFLTANQVLGHPVYKFEENLCYGKPEGSFHNFMLAFQKWLYTSSLESTGVRLVDLWHFGGLIGSPRLQNDALKTLCAPLSTHGRLSETFSLPDYKGKLCARGDHRLDKLLWIVCLDPRLNDIYLRGLVLGGSWIFFNIKNPLLTFIMAQREKGSIPWGEEYFEEFLLDENITNESSGHQKAVAGINQDREGYKVEVEPVSVWLASKHRSKLPRTAKAHVKYADSSTENESMLDDSDEDSDEDDEDEDEDMF